MTLQAHEQREMSKSERLRNGNKKNKKKANRAKQPTLFHFQNRPSHPAKKRDESIERGKSSLFTGEKGLKREKGEAELPAIRNQTLCASGPVYGYFAYQTPCVSEPNPPCFATNA